jgi:cytochrome b subunit of formate dehydrogenase
MNKKLVGFGKCFEKFYWLGEMLLKKILALGNLLKNFVGFGKSFQNLVVILQIFG